MRRAMLFLFAALLAGCGVKGTLAVPPPVFGAERTAPAPTPSGKDPIKDEIDADPLTPELPAEENETDEILVPNPLGSAPEPLEDPFNSELEDPFRDPFEDSPFGDTRE